MKTKYILIGGYAHRAQDEGKSLCEEMVAGFAEPVRILVCLFARPEEVWNEAFEKDKAFLAKHLPTKKVEMKCATIESFTEQVKWAQVIYFRGGATAPLLAALNKSGAWQSELQGKTVVGTSAGADAIAKYYYGLDELRIAHGLGLVPIKVIVHWKSDYNAPNVRWDEACFELEKYKEDLPVLKLAEGQFEVFYD